MDWNFFFFFLFLFGSFLVILSIDLTTRQFATPQFICLIFFHFFFVSFRFIHIFILQFIYAPPHPTDPSRPKINHTQLNSYKISIFLQCCFVQLQFSISFSVLFFSVPGFVFIFDFR